MLAELLHSVFLRLLNVAHNTDKPQLQVLVGATFNRREIHYAKQ